MPDHGADRGTRVSKLPTSAYSGHVAYDQGRNDRWPDQNFTYKHFTHLGNISPDDALEASQALALAQAKYGSNVRVMRTARYWVAYYE